MSTQRAEHTAASRQEIRAQNFVCVCVCQSQTDGNAEVVSALSEVGALLKEEQYEHKYPYDWRTKKPTIFRYEGVNTHYTCTQSWVDTRPIGREWGMEGLHMGRLQYGCTQGNAFRRCSV